MSNLVKKNVIKKIILVGLEFLLIILCLAAPLLEKMYVNDYDQWYKNYYMIDIFKKYPLSIFHQIAFLTFLITSCILFIVTMISLFIKLKCDLINMILFFLQCLSSFFFLMHFNYFGFLFEFLLVLSLFIIFMIKQENKQNQNGIFHNVIFSLILIIFMIVVIVSDLYYF